MKVTINNSNVDWYRDHGYTIPTYEYQKYTTKHGVRIKNGIITRVKNGTTIEVDIKDIKLKVKSKCNLICLDCKKEFEATYYTKKHRQGLCSICYRTRLANDKMFKLTGA